MVNFPYDSNTPFNPHGGGKPTSSVIVVDKREYSKAKRLCRLANHSENFYDFQLTVGNKYPSNLNEIGKSEQKLMGNNQEGYDWTKGKGSGAQGLRSVCWLITLLLTLLATHSHH